MVEETYPSQLLTVAIVYSSFLLDNILLTVVVPIIPDYLFSTNEMLIANVSSESIGPKSLSQLQRKFEALEKESGPVSVLLSSKALIQLVANPLVGYLTKILGYNIPLVIGSTNLLVASLLFAYGRSYHCLLIARVLHGTASACICVSGMCLVAEVYKGSTRARNMGFILGSVALGVLLGYPLGGVLYDFVGKTAPFVLIAMIIAVCVVVQLCYLDITYPPRDPITQTTQTPQGNGSWLQMLCDRSVCVATCAIWLSTTAMAILEPCLPLWMMANMQPAPARWELGTVFIPDSLGYLLGTNFTGLIPADIKRWRIGLVAMALVGFCSILIPSATTVKQLIIPHLGLGLGIGALDACLVPLLANLVDFKHGLHYGAVYALQQVAVSLAYSLGPLLAGETVKLIGFSWLMRIVGIINLIYTPLLTYLSKGEDKDLYPLVPNLNCVSYNTEAQFERINSSYKKFQNEDDDDDE